MNEENKWLLKYRKRLVVFFAIAFSSMLLSNILEFIILYRVDLDSLYNALMEYINNQTPFNLFDYIDTLSFSIYAIALFLDTLIYPFIILGIINLVKFVRLKKKILLANMPKNDYEQDNPYEYTRAEEEDYRRYQEERINEEIRKKESEAENLSNEIEQIKNTNDDEEKDEIFK